MRGVQVLLYQDGERECLRLQTAKESVLQPCLLIPVIGPRREDGVLDDHHRQSDWTMS